MPMPRRVTTTSTLRSSTVRCDACGQDAVSARVDQNGRRICGECDPSFDLVRLVEDPVDEIRGQPIK